MESITLSEFRKRFYSEKLTKEDFKHVSVLKSISVKNEGNSVIINDKYLLKTSKDFKGNLDKKSFELAKSKDGENLFVALVINKESELWKKKLEGGFYHFNSHRKFPESILCFKEEYNYMESITLKEWSAYLPYEVQVEWIREEDKKTICDTLSISDYYFLINEDAKPVLRPLSDLKKEIEVNGEKFVPIEKLPIIGMEVLELESDIKSGFIMQKNYNTLLEWHFDVFGLIDRGLAIDLNSI